MENVANQPLADLVSPRNSMENHLIMSSSSSFCLPMPASSPSVATMTNTIPDYLAYNVEELFNSIDDLLLGQAETQPYFNPDFFEFFPGFPAHLQVPSFVNNTPQSSAYNQPQIPTQYFTSNDSLSYSRLGDCPTNSSVQKSPTYRSASSTDKLTSPSYIPASPTYRPSSPSYQIASSSYRSQPSTHPPPMTCHPYSLLQPLAQNHPASYPSPPSSGRSSPYDDRYQPISSSSYNAQLELDETENLPRYAPPQSAPESQEFPEITNMDSFTRYLLDVPSTSEGEVPVKMSEDSTLCGSYNFAKSQMSPYPQSQASANLREIKQTQPMRGNPIQPACSQENENPPPTSQEAQKAVTGLHQQQQQPVCSQCGTRETSLWRKDAASGKPLCNACKLYFKVHICDYFGFEYLLLL